MAHPGVTQDGPPARVAVAADGWRDAVREACRPLLRAAAVEVRYVDACIGAVEDRGPYIVVAPGIALAHARPEDGVYALGLSVAVLDEPVEFGHATNDPVDVVFAFGSPDREQHVGLLAALSRRLLDGLADRLREAPSDAEASKILQEVIDYVDR